MVFEWILVKTKTYTFINKTVDMKYKHVINEHYNLQADAQVGTLL